jgi:hypothetical protein
MGLDLVALLAFVLGSIFLERVIIGGRCVAIFFPSFGRSYDSLIDS